MSSFSQAQPHMTLKYTLRLETDFVFKYVDLAAHQRHLMTSVNVTTKKTLKLVIKTVSRFHSNL